MTCALVVIYLLLVLLLVILLLLLLLHLFHDIFLIMNRRQQSPRLSLPNTTTTTTTKNWKSARALSERRRRASDIDAVASVIRDANHSSQSPPLPLIYSSHYQHDDIGSRDSFRVEMSSNRRRRLSITTDEALEIYDVALDNDSILYDINEINIISNNSSTSVLPTTAGKQKIIYEMNDYVQSDDECVVYDDDDLWESNNDFIDDDNVDDDNNRINDVDNLEVEEVEIDNSSNETEEIDHNKDVSDRSSSSSSTGSTVVSYLHRLNQRINSIREQNRIEYENKNVVGDDEKITSPPYMKKLSFSELGEFYCYFIVI